MQHPLPISSRMLTNQGGSPEFHSLLHQRCGRPAPRSAGEALSEGVRLALLHLRQVLLISIVGWAPGELVRLLTAMLPLSRSERLMGSLAALCLSLLGVAFVSAAVVGLLTRPSPAAQPSARADRAAALSSRRLWEVLAFGLLVACWMAPLGAASAASWTLLTAQGHCLLAHAIGMFLSYLGTLQCQGAAVGLALLYADACAEGGLPTRLGHLARFR